MNILCSWQALAGESHFLARHNMNMSTQMTSKSAAFCAQSVCKEEASAGDFCAALDPLN
jgi:hypothetical protein